MTSRTIGSRPGSLARLFLGALAGLALLTAPAVARDGEDPVIATFSAVVGANGAVTFSGTVTDDESLYGCLVRITGPGVNTVAYILANGTFNTSVTVFGTSPITVTAEAIDADGNTSDPVQATFTPISSPGGGGGPRHGTGGAG